MHFKSSAGGRTATSVFLCARRPCGRPGSRHAQWISAENETAPPGQEVLAGGFHESKL